MREGFESGFRALVRKSMKLPFGGSRATDGSAGGSAENTNRQISDDLI